MSCASHNLRTFSAYVPVPSTSVLGNKISIGVPASSRLVVENGLPRAESISQSSRLLIRPPHQMGMKSAVLIRPSIDKAKKNLPNCHKSR
jgi:hypothetical protein